MKEIELVDKIQSIITAAIPLTTLLKACPKEMKLTKNVVEGKKQIMKISTKNKALITIASYIRSFN
jgi:hypothetical protein